MLAFLRRDRDIVALVVSSSGARSSNGPASEESRGASGLSFPFFPSLAFSNFLVRVVLREDFVEGSDLSTNGLGNLPGQSLGIPLLPTGFSAAILSSFSTTSLPNDTVFRRVV